MKKLIPFIASVVVSSTAYAADLATQAVVTPAPTLKSTWTGAYAGLNAGGVWSSDASSANSTWPSYTNIAFSPASILSAAAVANSSSTGGYNGFIGGGQVGYNFAIGIANTAVVAGFETDIQGVAASNFNSSKSNIAPIPGGTGAWIATNNVSATLDYLGTARGRLGALITPDLLVYGTGGLAYGGVSSRADISWIGAPQGSFTAGGSNFYGGGSASNTTVGWSAGGGGEWMFARNWSAKAEYLYYNLGKLSYSSTASRLTNLGVASIYSTQTSMAVNGNLVRLGVNYHFDTSPLAMAVRY